jgi:hypothetical protein
VRSFQPSADIQLPVAPVTAQHPYWDGHLTLGEIQHGAREAAPVGLDILLVGLAIADLSEYVVGQVGKKDDESVTAFKFIQPPLSRVNDLIGRDLL